MELRLNANAVITNKEGKFLFIKLKGGPFAHGVSIPGGGINPGEFSGEAVKREILEETGIKIKENITPFGFCELINKPIKQHRVVLLLHAVADGEPKETEEGTSRWLTYEEAENELLPFTKEAIRIWKNKELHFTLVE